MAAGVCPGSANRSLFGLRAQVPAPLAGANRGFHPGCGEPVRAPVVARRNKMPTGAVTGRLASRASMSGREMDLRWRVVLLGDLRLEPAGNAAGPGRVMGAAPATATSFRTQKTGSLLGYLAY